MKFIKNKKIIIIILITIIISIISVIIFHTSEKTPTKKEEFKIKYNTNSGILEDKTVNNLAFTNITCSYDGKTSTIKYIISNISPTDDITIGKYTINIYDKNENLMTLIEPNINQTLKPGENYKTENQINIDLSKAYNMEIVF